MNLCRVFARSLSFGLLAAGLVGASFAAPACSSSAKADDGEGGAGGEGGAFSEEEPVYALVTLLWGDEGPIGYVALSRTIDQEDVTLDRAREFTGYTSVGWADGQLLVSPSADDPTLERYRISDALEWLPSETLSFLGEGVEGVGFHKQYMTQDQIAYVDVDVTDRVLWDPAALTLTGRRSDTLLEHERDGLQLYAALNRSHFVFDDIVFRPFAYHDDLWFDWSPDSELVIYSSKTHDAADVVTLPCPALDTITRDEGGNYYLSTFEYSGLYPLIGDAAAPCSVKIDAELRIDASWDTDLTSMTEGRFVTNFRYVGHGKAVGAVLHHEQYGEDFDFEALAGTDDFWTATAQYHRLWMFDVDAGTAAPISGIDELEFVNPGYFHAVLDGRTFVFLGDGSNGSNNFNETFVYEIDEQGAARLLFRAPGSVIQWVRLR